MVAVREILDVFGEASGLRVNYRKTSATLIRARDFEADMVRNLLRCDITCFPIRYLGLQLALRPLTKAQWQPMLDAAIHLVPAWQRGMIARPGRLTLVQSVMAAHSVHHLMIAEAPCWLLEEMAKGFRGFYWAAKARANGGQCIVAWDQVCKPRAYGGLGLKDLRLQGLALRVRWEWLSRTDPNRPWQSLPMATDKKAQEIFDQMVQITVGDGSRVLFWRDKWIQGRAAVDIAPSIAQKVSTRCRNSRMVAQGLENNRWTEDFQGVLTDGEAQECFALWTEIQATPTNSNIADQFSWPSPSKVYTAKSTYDRLAIGVRRFPVSSGIWKSKASPRCKDFMWRTMHDRLWTSDRRFWHGLQDHMSTCFVYLQEEDTTNHVLLQCVTAREVWHICRENFELNIEEPTPHSVFQDWWSNERKK
jgi:hypothetical protein